MEKKNTQAEDLIITSIKEIINKIQKEISDCENKIETSSCPVHQEQEKEKLVKLEYKQKSYVDLLVCYGKTGIFDLKQFNMVCKMLFNKEAIEFADQYLTAIQHSIELEKQRIDCLNRVNIYKHEKNLKYTEKFEKVVGAEITTCILQAMFGEKEKEKYLELREYIESELKTYNLLVFQKESIESIWKQQFDNWSENHIVLRAHMHVYLMLKEDTLRSKKNYQINKPTQYKKEMN